MPRKRSVAGSSATSTTARNSGCVGVDHRAPASPVKRQMTPRVAGQLREGLSAVTDGKVQTANTVACASLAPGTRSRALLEDEGLPHGDGAGSSRTTSSKHRLKPLIVDCRHIEASAYFTVAEALAQRVRHAGPVGSMSIRELFGDRLEDQFITRRVRRRRSRAPTAERTGRPCSTSRVGQQPPRDRLAGRARDTVHAEVPLR